MFEQLNQGVKCRSNVVRIFPNAACGLRLVRAVAVEIHENRLETIRFLRDLMLYLTRTTRRSQGGIQRCVPLAHPRAICSICERWIASHVR